MKNKLAYRLVTFLVILLGLGLLFGASYSPAIVLKSSSKNVNADFVQIFTAGFSTPFYFIFLVVLLILGLMLGLYYENKTIGLLGSGVALASSLGFLYVAIAFLVENKRFFDSTTSQNASFDVNVPYFLVVVGIALLILLSIFALLVNLLPQTKKAEAESK
jgi:hypothetical protein